ncbi:MAG: hypothetical protein NZ551_11380 [Microscillaceae bacterium]|nr:hypothetical protein [Microscillaceae bacterium]MDW8461796.1 hypothetical protein [Cytophagales bacterium]
MRSLKAVLVCLLITMVICKIAGKLWLVAYVELNREYIAEVLCINKNRPEMACQGQCHINQIYQETEEQEQPNPFQLLQQDFFELFFQELPIFQSTSSYFLHLVKHQTLYFMPALADFFEKRTKPPQFI